MAERLSIPYSLTPIPILYTTAFADCVGGGQKSLLLLLSQLDRAKIVPHLWVPGEGAMQHAAKTTGVSGFAAPLPRLRFLFSKSVAVAAYVQKHGIKIIHTDDPSTALWCGLRKRALGVRVVFHARVSDRSFVDGLIERTVDRVIAVSQSAAARFRRAVVVYNAADLSVAPLFPADREDGTLHVGYFGRIHPRKGLSYLIAAAKKLPYLRLHIFGAGEKKYVQHLEETTSGAAIAWYGFVSDVREAMSMVDCVVLPAVENEGLSRMLIDAMAMGKAVVGTDISANAELFGADLSFALCRQRSTALLVDAIERVRAFGLAKTGKLARARAESVLDAAKNTRAIEAVYEELLR